jgi:hypothetical protein
VKEGVMLKAASTGQEFVLNCDDLSRSDHVAGGTSEAGGSVTMDFGRTGK